MGLPEDRNITLTEKKFRDVILTDRTSKTAAPKYKEQKD